MREKLILVTDYTWPSLEAEEEVLAAVGAQLVAAKKGDEEELLALVPEADAILTCFAQVTPAVIRAGARLQVIGRYGIGVDNIAVETATELGIPVTNVPEYCVDEVSDHAMALMLACARQVIRYDRAVHQGNWDLAVGAPLYRLRGRTLGLLGLGRIGQAVARKAKALGLVVLACHPHLSAEEVARRGAEKVGFEELLQRADFLSLHLPLTAETKGIMNERALRLMKPTAFLINTARGALLDQEALVRALKEGWIAGAALDVLVPERLPPGHLLLNLPNCIVTPHVAFYSEESVHDLEVLAATNVAELLAGRRPRWVVNPAAFQHPRWAGTSLASQ